MIFQCMLQIKIASFSCFTYWKALIDTLQQCTSWWLGHCSTMSQEIKKLAGAMETPPASGVSRSCNGNPIYRWGPQQKVETPDVQWGSQMCSGVSRCAMGTPDCHGVPIFAVETPDLWWGSQHAVETPGKFWRPHMCSGDPIHEWGFHLFPFLNSYTEHFPIR